MLSLSEVKKHLPAGSADEDAERIRTELNQIATVLVTEYLAKKNKRKLCQK